MTVTSPDASCSRPLHRVITLFVGTMRTDDLCLLFKNSLSFETEDLKTYIIDLLNKFEVALLWDGCNLLIPSLLPTEHDIQSGRPGADIRVSPTPVAVLGTVKISYCFDIPKRK